MGERRHRCPNYTPDLPTSTPGTDAVAAFAAAAVSVLQVFPTLRPKKIIAMRKVLTHFNYFLLKTITKCSERSKITKSDGMLPFVRKVQCAAK